MDRLILSWRGRLPTGRFIAIPQCSSLSTISNAIYRTLFVSAAGLENAKRIVSAYKQGQEKVMTTELWRAKKIVDSTLHPGASRAVARGCVPGLTSTRHRPAGLPPFPNVLLCYLESCCYRWHAHPWSPGSSTTPVPSKVVAGADFLDNRNPTLANNQSIPQRCNQQRQCQ